MFDYMKAQGFDTFVTLQKACEILGLTKDELRTKCEQYGVSLYNWDGQWGFPIEHFRCFNNTLYFEQCRDGSDDSCIFINTPATRSKAYQSPQQQVSALSHISNIRGLESTYTLDEACSLLQFTLDVLEKICKENGILILEDLDGTQYFTCYDFLTLNNILYRKKHVIAEEGSPCA